MRRSSWLLAALAIALLVALASGLAGYLRQRHTVQLNALLSAELLRQSTLSNAGEPVDATTVEELVNRGASIHLQVGSGWTPLLCAVAANDEDLVTRLLQRGASPNVTDRRGWSVLRYAVWANNPRAVQFLLTHGALVDERDQNGMTPLMAIAAWPDAEDSATIMAPAMRQELRRESGDRAMMARAVLEGGADINATDRAGNPALKYAAWMGNVRITRLLLESGARVQTVNQTGNTPLGFAVAHGNRQIVDMLRRAGARETLEDRLSAALMKENLEETRRLLRQGANVNASNLNSGDPVILVAARKGDIDLVQDLLRKGAAVNRTGALNHTPLLAAVAAGHAQVVELLLSHGADTSIREVSGKTPLDIAQRRGDSRIISMIERHSER